MDFPYWPSFTPVLIKSALQRASVTMRIPKVGIARAKRLVRTAALARARRSLSIASSMRHHAHSPNAHAANENTKKRNHENRKVASTYCIVHNIACSLESAWPKVQLHTTAPIQNI